MFNRPSRDVNYISSDNVIIAVIIIIPKRLLFKHLIELRFL